MQQQEADVVEYNIIVPISIHCRECGNHIGLASDVLRVAKMWIMQDLKFNRCVETAPVMQCQLCATIVAEWLVLDEYEIHRASVILRH